MKESKDRVTGRDEKVDRWYHFVDVVQEGNIDQYLKVTKE